MTIEEILQKYNWGNITGKDSLKTMMAELLEKEIKRAYVHGQGNQTMMEAGLERDETEDYLHSRMAFLTKSNK